MRNNIYYFLCLLLCPALLHAQIPSLDWALSYGNASGSHYPVESAVDAAGNLYVVGDFSATTGALDLDPGPGTANQTSIGSNSVSIQVFDPAGNLINSGALISQTAGASYVYVRGFEMDAAGNLYLAGDFVGNVDVDPTAGTNIITPAAAQAVGATDNFVLKLDNALNLQWVHSYGSFNYDNVYDLAVDASANVFVVGSFYGGADYDPTAGVSNIASNGGPDFFVQKFDNNGNFQWVRTAGAGGFDGGFGVGTDAAGNVIVTGNFQGTVDFDPGAGTQNLTATASYDVFVWKLDAAGNYVWATQSTGGNSNQGQGVTTDASNNIYIGGLFAGTVDFDPSAGVDTESSTGNPDADVFVWKLDANANHQWVAGIGNNNAGDGFLDIEMDAAGNVYTVGYFAGTNVDFDPGPGTLTLSAASNDAFVQKLDASGNLVYAFDLGAASNDQGRTIAIMVEDEFYLSGLYNNTVDFDPSTGVTNLISTGGADGFITKYAPPIPATALYLDGGNDEVVIPNVAEFSPASGEITYECWAIATAATWEQGTLVGHRVAPNTGGQVRGIMTNAGSTTISFFIDGAIVNYAVPNIQQWHHYAGTYDGATLRFYVDGVLVGQTAYTGGIANYTDDLRIGHDYCCGARFARAIIDEVRLWDYARCVTEIGAQKDCELVGNETGLIAYYDFNQGFDAANNSSETILLDRQTNIPANNGTLTNMTLNGASSNWVDGTVNGVSGNCTTTGFPEVAITEFIADPSGVDNTDEWVEIHNYGATSYDLNGWRISDEGVDDDPIASASTMIAAGESYIIAKNKIQFESLWLNGCPNDKVLEVAGLTLANAPDEIIIHDNNGCKVHQVAYIGDERVGRATWYTEAYPPATRVWGTSAGNQIDRQANDGATGTTGYDENSTTADPNMRQANGSSDFGSPLNGNSDAVDIVRDEALSLDGNSYVEKITPVGFATGNAPRTLEAWVKTTTTNGVIVNYSSTGLVNNERFSLLVFGGGRILVVGAGNDFLGNTSITDGEWHHVAATHDGTTARLYIDGVLDASAPKTYNTQAARLDIGANQIAGERFNGEIDEVRVWAVQRTEDEIRENMHLTFTGCETGLAAYYQMNDGAPSTTVADKSGQTNGGTFVNTPSWVSSGVNVGNDGAGNSNSVTNTGVATGVSNFAAANLSIDFTAHSATEDICVTYEAFTPNDNATGVSGTNTIDNPMWTVNKSTASSTQTMNITFTFPAATLTTANPCELKLYNRAMGADGTWTLVGTASNATATTATFDGVTTVGQFMIVEDNTVGADIVRDQTLNFDGSNQHIYIGNFNTPNTLTVEAWVNPNNVTGLKTIMAQYQAWPANCSYILRLDNGIPVLYISDGIAGSSISSGQVLNTNQWYHVAASYDGITANIYVNGILMNSGGLASGSIYQTTGVEQRIGGSEVTGEYFDGQIDEAKMWSIIRTEAEIRENMHLTLDGCESGLVGYYQMNEGSGTIVADKSGNGNDGTTRFVPTWTPSSVNVGNDVAGNSNSVTNAGVATGASNFAAANLSIDFTAHSATEDICVTYEAFTPNATTGASGTNLIDNPMWTVNKSTVSSTQSMDMTFTFPATTITSTDPCELRLYSRAMGEDGAWVYVGKASSVTATTATFDGVTVTGQFMVVEETNPLGDIVRDQALSFDGIDDWVDVNNSANVQLNSGTLEGWIKTSNPGAGARALFIKQYAYSLFLINNELALYDWSISGWRGTGIMLNDNNWHHVALVFNSGVVNGTSIYLDGVLVLTTTMTITSQAENFILGKGADYAAPTQNFSGQLDEVRLWNAIRTEDEIRENMHLTLDGCESGLVGYYQMNEGSGTTILDKSGNGNDGTIGGATAPIWTPSGVNVGNDAAGNSNSVTNAGVATGVSTFAAANLSIDFTAHSTTEDICVTYEAFTPNATTGASGTNLIDNPIWTVNKSTASSTQSMNMTFTFPATTLTSTDPCELRLYNRAMGEDGAWTFVRKASSATATTATFDGVTVTGQFMVVEDTNPLGDIVRDQALDFNGADDRVSVGDLGAVSDWTIETWFKPNGLNNYENIFHSVDASGNLGVRLELSNNWGDGHLYVSVSGNGAFTPHTIVPLGGNLPDEWHHIAIVGEQTSNKIYVYLNGIKVVDANHTNWVSTFPDFVIGQGFNASPSVRDFSGLLDEFRIWKTTRTEDEIRENMHLTLDGCEAGLAAYYQMNEGSGTSIVDKSGNGNNGTLVGVALPTWTPSGVNVGNDATGNSNSVTLSVPTGASAQSFGAANLIMEFIEHSATEDFTATYQEFTPNVKNGIPYTNIYDNPIWTVNKSTSASTHIANMTFSFPAGPFTLIDGSKYRLYWRPMNAESDWSQIAAQAEVLSASAIKFTRIPVTGQFMVVQASEFEVTDVRGEMYAFDGTQYLDHTATASGLPQGNGARTIEAWVKTTQGTIGNIVSWGRRSNNLRNGVAVRSGRLGFIGEFNDLTGNIIINDGEWHHIAVTHDGSTLILYVDGVLDVSSNRTLNTTDQNLRIGIISLPASDEIYNGDLDEVRIWSVARTQAQLRENMHLTLKGSESGLVSYYQFNKDTWDGANHTIMDAKGLNHGISVNMAEGDRVDSEVAVAGGVSQRLDVFAGGVNVDFDIPGVTINFGTPPNGEIVVSRLETQKPTGWSAVGADVDNEYFVVWNYGSDQNPQVNRMIFKNIGYIPTTANTTDIDLYKRGSREFGPTWTTNLGNASTMTTGAAATVEFAGAPLTTGFSQFVIVGNNNTDLPVELLAFEAERINAGEVELDWSTASELNNKGFEIERMLEGEAEFSNVGFVEGAGTTLETTNYQYTDENAFEGVSYYRLKQLDENGHFEYSETRAVFGVKAVSEIAVYPNPTKDVVNVRFSNLNAKTEATIELLDAQGKLIYKSIEKVNSQELLTISEMNKLPSGLYMLSIRLDNGSKLMKKIVKK